MNSTEQEPVAGQTQEKGEPIDEVVSLKRDPITKKPVWTIAILSGVYQAVGVPSLEAIAQVNEFNAGAFAKFIEPANFGREVFAYASRVRAILIADLLPSAKQIGDAGAAQLAFKAAEVRRAESRVRRAEWQASQVKSRVATIKEMVEAGLLTKEDVKQLLFA